MQHLTIDPEFKALIPPLTPEERKGLEDSLIKEGCRDDLVVWNGTLVDGHNRYEICSARNIPFRTTEKQFADRDEAVMWIIQNQFSRRNLQNFQRSELALKMKAIIAAKAREQRAETEGRPSKEKLSQKSDAVSETEKIRTDEELAKLAGVSRDTIRKTEEIIKKGTPEQKERARKGGTGNTVNAIFGEVKRAENPEKRLCKKCGQWKDPSEFYDDRNVCKACRNGNKKMCDFLGNEIGDKALERKLIPLAEKVEHDLHDPNREIVIPPDALYYSVNSIVQTFINSLERSRGDNPVEVPEECAQKIIAVLSEAEAAIQKMKGWLIHE